MAMAMQCGAQATFVSAVVSRASRCPCRKAGSAPSLSVKAKSMCRYRCGYTPICAPAIRARSKSKFSVMVHAQAQPQSASDGVSVAGVTSFKHVMLAIHMDRNPLLSEATRQAAASTTALATKFGADITVVVIDERSASREDSAIREKNIRRHLSEGGFEEFTLEHLYMDPRKGKSADVIREMAK